MPKKDRCIKNRLQAAKIAAGFIFCILFGAFCPGTVDAVEKIRLQLAWKHQFQFAGYYAALHKGLYRDAGLDVRIIEGGEGKFAREELLEGRAEYGVAGAELLLHRQDGDPFVVLAPIFQHSPSILLARKDSGITHLQDLIGKRVMLLKGKKDADILAGFLNEGIPLDSIRRLDQTFDLNDLIEGRTDAVSAYSTNEPWHLKQKGVEPQILSPRTYGVDFYSDCLFTTEDEIRTRPKKVRKFLEASVSGWEYAMNHPDEIIDILISEYDVKKSRAHLEYEAQEIRKIMLPDLVEIGHMNPGRWRHIGRTYAKLGLIDTDFSLQGFLYNPNPAPDHTLLKWGAGILIAILLLVSGGAFVLFIYNRKLTEEINERKQIEKELQASEDRFKQLFANSPSGVAVYSAVRNGEDFVFVDFNKAAEKIENLDRNTLIGRNVLEAFPRIKEFGLFDVFQRVWRTGRPEYLPTAFYKDQRIAGWRENYVYKLDSGELVAVYEDITERKRAEEALLESEKRFREILEDVSYIAVQGYDEQRRVTFWNPASENLYGYRKEEALGRKIEDLIVPPQMKDEVIKRHGRWLEYGEKIPASEMSLMDKNGDRVPVFSSHVLHDTVNGREMFCIDVDLRAFKKAEKEKEKAQKAAAEHEKYSLVGRIAGKMAHDFNNILGAVMGNAELAVLDCPHEPTRQTLHLIVEQVMRGRNLTRNLVAFAKDQEPKQEYFSINEKIELVLNLLKKDLKNMKIVRKLDPDLPDLLADPGMIEHSLVNMIQNSIHATGKSEDPKLIIRTFPENGHIQIEVEDNGCGIPEDVIDRIYEPAFTLKGSRDTTGAYASGVKGSGYGMANVKRYVELHKGEIFIDSVVDRGTRVAIRLPVIRKKLSEAETAEIRENAFYSGKSVLLVEDEQDISNVQYRILTGEPCGHKVDIASNGRMAVDLFDRNHYDLVSLDYVLPDEISGLDVYRHIRQKDSDIPILFISGNLEFLASIKELKRNDPFVDHLSKPCRNKAYIDTIHQLLDSSAKESARFKHQGD